MTASKPWKLPALFLLLAAFGIEAPEAAAQRESFELYTGCARINLVVEGVSKDIESIGISEKSVRAMAESRLRSARIFSGDDDRHFESVLRPYLYINVNGVGHGFFWIISLAKYVHDPLSEWEGFADTWETGGVGTHSGDGEFVMGALRGGHGRVFLGILSRQRRRMRLMRKAENGQSASFAANPMTASKRRKRLPKVPQARRTISATGRRKCGTRYWKMEELRLDDCAAVPSERMAGLGGLGVTHPGIAALKAGDFDSLPALEHLGLYSNRLAALPPGIFDNLAAMEELALHENHLVGLTGEHPLFGGLALAEAHLVLHGQTELPSPPPCDPDGGFPSCPETEPEPPAPEDLAARLASHQASIEALQVAIEALQAADATHADRLDAFQENMPPRRLRLWAPAPDGEPVKTPADG